MKPSQVQTRGGVRNVRYCRCFLCGGRRGGLPQDGRATAPVPRARFRCWLGSPQTVLPALPIAGGKQARDGNTRLAEGKAFGLGGDGRAWRVPLRKGGDPLLLSQTAAAVALRRNGVARAIMADAGDVLFTSVLLSGDTFAVSFRGRAAAFAALRGGRYGFASCLLGFRPWLLGMENTCNMLNEALEGRQACTLFLTYTEPHMLFALRRGSPLRAFFRTRIAAAPELSVFSGTSSGALQAGVFRYLRCSILPGGYIEHKRYLPPVSPARTSALPRRRFPYMRALWFHSGLRVPQRGASRRAIAPALAKHRSMPRCACSARTQCLREAQTMDGKLPEDVGVRCRVERAAAFLARRRTRQLFCSTVLLSLYRWQTVYTGDAHGHACPHFHPFCGTRSRGVFGDVLALCARNAAPVSLYQAFLRALPTLVLLPAQRVASAGYADGLSAPGHGCAGDAQRRAATRGLSGIWAGWAFLPPHFSASCLLKPASLFTTCPLANCLLLLFLCAPCACLLGLLCLSRTCRAVTSSATADGGDGATLARTLCCACLRLHVHATALAFACMQ